MAILASPNSADSSAIVSRDSSEYDPGMRASDARTATISLSSDSLYLLNLTVLVLRNVDMDASSRRFSIGSWEIIISDTGAASARALVS